MLNEQNVVSMRFDNRDFEKNAEQSLKTIDQIKKSMNFDKSAGSLSELSKATKQVDFNPLNDGVQKFKMGFSALDAVAFNVVSNLTNSMINLGKEIAGCIAGLKGMADGFQMYELKMNAVQTIMSATGESMNSVNGYMEELNDYAVQTVYSLSDMTQNIAKFTNNGVSLRDAVDAIKGVSNEAAISGANAQEASRAMYNFSQALSQGCVKLIDWKSIENANMATKGFKEELIKTALEVGTLVEAEEGYKSTTLDLNGNTSEVFQSTKKFNESLSSQWMTTEVLTKTLKRYSDANTDIGKKAYAAAQDIKTFSQMMDTVKEEAATGWSITYETLFGNMEEAKKLWTSVGNVIQNAVQESYQARNKLLKSWKKLGGRTKLINAIGKEFNNLCKIFGAVGKAFRSVFPKTTGKDLLALTKGFSKLVNAMTPSKKVLESITNITKTLLTPVKILVTILGNCAKIASAIFKQLAHFIGTLSIIVGNIAELGNSVYSAVPILDLFNTSTKFLAKTITTFGNTFNKWFRDVVVGASKIEFPTEICTVFGQVATEVSKRVNTAGLTIKKWFSKTFMGIDIEKAAPIPGKINIVAESVEKLSKVFNQFHSKVAAIFHDVKAWFYKSFLGIDIANAKPIENSVSLVTRTFEAFDDVVAKVGLKVSQVANKVVAFFGKKFLGIDPDSGKEVTLTASKVTTTIEKFRDVIGNTYDKISKWFKGTFMGLDPKEAAKAEKETTTIASFFEKLGNTIVEVANGIANAIGIIWKGLKELLSNVFDFDIFAESLNLAGSAGVVIGLTQLATGLKAVAKSLKGNKKSGSILDSLKGTLDNLRKTLAAYTTSIQADALKKIAIAIAILTLSLIGLSAIKADKLEQSVSAMLTLFSGLLGTMAILAKLTTISDSLSLVGPLTTAMIKASAAILIIAKAMQLISGIPEKDISKALLTIAAVMGELIAMVAIMSKIKGVNKSVKQFTSIAIAMNLFAVAIAILGSLDTDQCIQGVVTIGAILAELGIASRLVKPKTLTKVTASILTLGIALNIFALAVKQFGAMNSGSALQGVACVGIILAELAVTSRLINTKQINTFGLSLMALGVALGLFADAAIKMGNLKFDQALQAVACLGLLCGELALVSLSMKKMDTTGILAMSVLLVSLTSAFTKIAMLKPEQIMNGMIGLGVALTELAAALTAISLAGGAIQGAAALLIVAPALIGIATALKILGSLELETILKGLATFAATLGILGIAAAVLSPMVPALLAVAGALALIGVACLTAGAGVALLGTGLLTIGTALPALLAGLSTVVTTFITALITGIKQAFALIAATNTVTIIMNSIIVLVKTVFTGILKTIKEVGPLLIETVMALVMSLLHALDNNLGEIVMLVIKIFLQCIAAVIKQIPTIIKVAVDLVGTLLDSLSKQLPRLLEMAINFIVTFVNGLAQAVSDHADDIATAAENLILAFVDVIIATLSKLPDLLLQLAKKAWAAFHDGSTESFPKSWSDVGDLLKGIWKKFKDKIKEWWNKGVEGIKEFGKGIKEKAKDAWNEVGDMIKGCIKKIKDKVGDWIDAGKNAIKGFIDGIGSKIGNAVDKAKEMARAAVDGAKSELDIHSPSRVFYQIGAYVVDGFTNGMDQNGHKVKNTTKKIFSVGKTAINEIQKDLKKSWSVFHDYAEFTDNDGKKIAQTAERAAKAYKDFRKAVKESLKGTEGDFSEFSIQSETSMSEMISGLKSQTAGIKLWAQELRVLIDRGLNQKLAQSFAEMGTQSAAYVDALTGASKKQIKELNKAYEARNRINAKASSEVVNGFLASGKKMSDATAVSLAKLKVQMKEFKKSVESAAASATSLFDAFNNSTDETTKSIQENIKSQTDGLKRWAKELTILKERGLSTDLMNALLSLGVNGAKYTSVLVTMTDKELKDLNKLYAERLKVNSTVAKQLTNSFYNVGKNNGNAYKKGLKSSTKTKKKTNNSAKKTAKKVAQEEKKKAKAQSVANKKKLAQKKKALQQEQKLNNARIKMEKETAKSLNKLAKEQDKKDTLKSSIKNYAKVKPTQSDSKYSYSIQDDLIKDRTAQAKKIANNVKKQITEVINWTYKDALNETKESLSYGKDTYEEFCNYYLKTTQAAQNSSKAIDEISDAISKYNDAATYTTQTETLSKHQEELANLQSQLDDYQSEYNDLADKYTLSDKKRKAELEQLISDTTSSVEAATKAVKDDQQAILDSRKSLYEEVASVMDKYGIKSLTDFTSAEGESTKNIKLGTEALEAAKKAVEAYGQRVYELSDYYVEDTEALITYQDQLTDLTKQKKQLEKEISAENKKNTKEAKANVKALKLQLSDVQKAMKETQESITEQEKIIAEHTAAAFDDLHSSIASTVYDFIDPLNASYDTGIDIFTEFSKSDAVSAGDLINNMQSQVTAIDTFQKNLLKLKDKGVSDALIEDLRSKGVSASNYVESFLSMTTDQINQANLLYAESASQSGNMLVASFKETLDKTTEWADAMEKLAERGLSQDILEELGNKGVSGLEQVRAFLAMDDYQLAQLNQAYENSLTIPSAVADKVIAAYARAGADSIDGFVEAINNLAESGLDDTLAAQETATEIGEILHDNLVNAMDGAGEEVTERLQNGILVSKDCAVTAADILGNEILNTLEETLGADKMTEIGAQITAGISASIANNIDSSIPDDIVERLAAAFPSQEVADSMFRQFEDGVESNSTAKQDAINSMSKVLKEIQEKAAKQQDKSDMERIGQNMMKGVANGIDSGSKKAKKSGKKAAKGTAKAVKNELGIHSPSKVFAEIGKYMCLGMAKGITGNMDTVQTESISALRSTIDTLKDSVDAEMDVNPTITPVMDLTEIQNGVTRVGAMITGAPGLNSSITLAEMTSGNVSSTYKANNDILASLNSLQKTLSGMANSERTCEVHNEFTINSANGNPKEIANEVSRILQHKVERREITWA